MYVPICNACTQYVSGYINKTNQGRFLDQGCHLPSNIGRPQNILRAKRWLWPEVQSMDGCPDGQKSRWREVLMSRSSDNQKSRCPKSGWPEVQISDD